jgi:hypothetical protein
VNISAVNLERPLRVQPPEPPLITRVAASQKKLASASPLSNVSLHIVPRVSEDRGASIARAAYLIAARRGFTPGHELEDWLAAENEVDQRLAGEGRVF